MLKDEIEKNIRLEKKIKTWDSNAALKIIVHLSQHMTFNDNESNPRAKSLHCICYPFFFKEYFIFIQLFKLFFNLLDYYQKKKNDGQSMKSILKVVE